uniref:Proteasomal ubiquitin receptor ADRM1 homolog n=1 Tax=Heligmosomoides polygyrus TaxID=6339 RepID=A0A183GH37_HELPZ
LTSYIMSCFQAGRSFLQPAAAPNKKKVVADKTKGQVFIKQSSDQLMHFCWKNRETGAVVDDLIIFPGDTEFKEVKGCPDGKVYMLKFKTSDERRLFWIQDGNAEADKDLCKKVSGRLLKHIWLQQLNSKRHIFDPLEVDEQSKANRPPEMDKFLGRLLWNNATVPFQLTHCGID